MSPRRGFGRCGRPVTIGSRPMATTCRHYRGFNRKRHQIEIRGFKNGPRRLGYYLWFRIFRV